MATLKSIWKDKEGNYVAIINLDQTEILMREDRTVPPGVLVPPILLLNEDETDGN